MYDTIKERLRQETLPNIILGSIGTTKTYQDIHPRFFIETHNITVWASKFQLQNNSNKLDVCFLSQQKTQKNKKHTEQRVVKLNSCYMLVDMGDFGVWSYGFLLHECLDAALCTLTADAAVCGRCASRQTAISLAASYRRQATNVPTVYCVVILERIAWYAVLSIAGFNQFYIH